MVAELDNPPEVEDEDEDSARDVPVEFAEVSLVVAVELLPGEGSPCVVDAVVLTVAETEDPGTVGLVSSILRSDCCQRTWMPNTRSSVSDVATHLLYDDTVPVRQVYPVGQHIRAVSPEMIGPPWEIHPSAAVAIDDGNTQPSE